MDTDILERQADVLFANIDGWEEAVIKRIGNRIKAIGEMSVADVKELNNIAAVKQDMEAVTMELAKATGMNISQIEQIYGDTLAEQHLANNALYDFRGKKFVPFADNKELQAMVRAYAKTTAGTMLNISKTKGLCVINEYGRPVVLKKWYNDVLDKAVMQVASGASDFHSAMRRSITALGGSGVRVDYGGGITRRLDTVVRQAVLWGAKQASNEYNEMIGNELGCDGIEIDYHRNTRPTHEFMQGKQYALGGAKTVNGIKYESADEALERLNDYGCLHFKTPILLGISEPAYSDAELKRLRAEDAKQYEIDGRKQNGYEWSQDMRKLETYMREQNRIKVAAQASGDKVLVKQCNERIKVAKAKYEQISDVTGIRQDPTRFTIPRQPRTINDALTSNYSSGIMYGEKVIKSVGAKSPTYPVVYYPGTDIQVQFVPGSRPIYPPDHTMAGKGCKTKRDIDDIDRLVYDYNCNANGWQKEKAIYEVYDEYGEIRQVELHWYQHEDIGKVEHKVKTKGGRAYIDEW